MKLFLNKTVVNKDLVSVFSSLSYNKPMANLQTIPLQISIAHSEFITHISSMYQTVCNAIKKDDTQYHETSEFTHTHYCNLEVLLKNYTNVMPTLSYIEYEVLAHFFSTDNFTYLIHSTKSITSKNNHVIFECEVVAHKTLRENGNQ